MAVAAAVKVTAMTAAETKANAGSKPEVGTVVAVTVVVIADPATHAISISPPAAPIRRLFDSRSCCAFQFATRSRRQWGRRCPRRERPSNSRYCRGDEKPSYVHAHLLKL